MLTQLKLINRGSRSVLLLAHAGLAGACCALFFLLVLVGALASYLETHLFGHVPKQELRVVLKTKDVSIMRIADGKTAIEAGDLEAMAKLAGITAVYPIRYADQAADINVNFMGQQFSSEIVIQAFEPEWIAADVPLEKLRTMSGLARSRNAPSAHAKWSARSRREIFGSARARITRGKARGRIDFERWSTMDGLSGTGCYCSE